MRVRVQLDTLDARLEAELRAAKPDSRAIREITDAQVRLSEQERILAGRPLPGSRRPAPDRADRRQGRAVVMLDGKRSERGRFLVLATPCSLCTLWRMARELRVEYPGVIYHEGVGEYYRAIVHCLPPRRGGANPYYMAKVLVFLAQNWPRRNLARHGRTQTFGPSAKRSATWGSVKPEPAAE